jgi:hypothetical protein
VLFEFAEISCSVGTLSFRAFFERDGIALDRKRRSEWAKKKSGAALPARAGLEKT